MRGTRIGRTATALALVSAAGLAAAPGTGAAASTRAARREAAPTAPATGDTFWVGAAKADITPTSLAGVYLGGYGIGPMHPATAVLRPIYARSLAVRDSAGHQAVVTTLDVQGHFLAYSNGPYGFADMAATLHRQLGIPVVDMLFQSTHTHNGPDDLGIWGGVPTSYLRRVVAQTEQAVRTAVRHERPARLDWTTVGMTGFTGTFGRTGDGDDGDTTNFPVDPTMRVLQAVGAHRHVIATLVDFASHATVYGPLDKVSPDWPGATATYLEHDERGMARRQTYGDKGSVGLVVEGDLGHTWPAGIPRQNTPSSNPPKARDDNYPADAYGNAIARVALAALHQHHAVVAGGIRAAVQSVTVANDNPVLLAGLANPVSGLQAYRDVLPPYGAGDALTTEVPALRIGNLLFAGAPGEEYPSLNAALAPEVPGATVFPVSLADDQLGYMGSPADYVAAQECSLTDEGFFTISPLFGNQVLQAQRQDAQSLGFTVTGANGLTQTGQLPISAACLSSQLP